MKSHNLKFINVTLMLVFLYQSAAPEPFVSAWTWLIVAFIINVMSFYTNYLIKVFPLNKKTPESH